MAGIRSHASQTSRARRELDGITPGCLTALQLLIVFGPDWRQLGEIIRKLNVGGGSKRLIITGTMLGCAYCIGVITIPRELESVVK